MCYKIYVLREALPLSFDFLKENKFEYVVVESEQEIPENSEKKIIYKVNKGKFLNACPGTPKYICCGYYVLAPVENCPFSCTYCILNAYFKTRNITVYVNTGDMIKELESVKGKSIKRIGTGEFSDSFAIPETRLYLAPVLDFFDKNNEITLELKTKSSFIPKPFFEKKYKNVIFSWSLNSSFISTKEELNTATIDDRIKAAKRVNEYGYRVSFHFDPIIYYEGWDKDYYKTIEKIFCSIPDRDIVWISLGTLRFLPELKEIATSLYPNTKIFNAEFIRAIDGKNRYFRKRRVDMYKKVVEMIRKFSSKVFVYLCMENEDVWFDVFSLDMNSKLLKEKMDEQV